MKCNVCGRQTQNEEANFCEYCGSSYRERFQTPNHMPPREQGFPNVNTQPPMMTQTQANRMTGIPNVADENKPMSFLNFLGSYGIYFIPYVGGIIFLVMLIVWAFSGNTPTTKKNWARATIIFMVALFISIAFSIALALSNPIFQNMINESINYSKSLQSLYQ